MSSSERYIATDEKSAERYIYRLYMAVTGVDPSDRISLYNLMN